MPTTAVIGQPAPGSDGCGFLQVVKASARLRAHHAVAPDGTAIPAGISHPGNDAVRAGWIPASSLHTHGASAPRSVGRIGIG